MFTAQRHRSSPLTLRACFRHLQRGCLDVPLTKSFRTCFLAFCPPQYPRHNTNLLVSALAPAPEGLDALPGLRRAVPGSMLALGKQPPHRPKSHQRDQRGALQSPLKQTNTPAVQLGPKWFGDDECQHVNATATISKLMPTSNSRARKLSYHGALRALSKSS